MNAADALIMGQRRYTALSVSRMQDQKLLMHHWRSFLGGVRDIVTSIFADKGGRWVDYELTPFCSPQIVQDAIPKIVDVPLMLIFRRW